MKASLLKKIYSTMERERARHKQTSDASLEETHKSEDREPSFLRYVLLAVVPVSVMFLYHMVYGK